VAIGVINGDQCGLGIQPHDDSDALAYPVVQFLVVRLEFGSFNSTGIVNELDHDVDCLFLASLCLPAIGSTRP
jgi:hypothetical protein